jgi:8-oxo-dGTP pyrophosphatase MutT (NUDIX family)
MTTPTPKLRTDVVDVYIFRRTGLRDEPEFLQLLRVDKPMEGTWQPVMGHAEAWETSVQAALRELEEETGLAREDQMLVGFWALEQIHPYFIASLDAIIMSPRFVAEVAPEWEPRLNDEHQSLRWVPAASIDDCFLWPGQRAATREALADIIPYTSKCRDYLKIDHASVKR